MNRGRSGIGKKDDKMSFRGAAGRNRDDCRDK
jgi:hypothetical protein